MVWGDQVETGTSRFEEDSGAMVTVSPTLFALGCGIFGGSIASSKRFLGQARPVTGIYSFPIPTARGTAIQLH
jgi:hypothetical protein